MSVERIFHCDGPECDRHVRTLRATPPMFLVVADGIGDDQHFCGWDCVLRFAATKEPETTVSGSVTDAD